MIAQVGNDRAAALKELERRVNATNDPRLLSQIEQQRDRIENDLRFFERTAA